MTYLSRDRRCIAWRSTPAGWVLSAGGALLAVGCGIAVLSADVIVARGFSAALEAKGPGTTVRDSVPPVAGSEDYWLMRTRGQLRGSDAQVETAALPVPAIPFSVTVGDRITVASAGRERVFEVVDVVEASVKVTRIESGEVPHRQLIVTCRDASAGDGRLVRFLTDPEPASGVRPSRTL